MKTDELYNTSSVDVRVLAQDVSKTIEEQMADSEPITEWIERQKADGYRRSYGLFISYFGDSQSGKDEPRLPPIELMVEQLNYALEIYSERHSDVHLTLREWKAGYPNIEIDFCVEFSSRRPLKFLNFLTVFHALFDEFMENELEFLGQTYFRDFSKPNKPERDEKFYTAEIFLTTMRYGYCQYCRTLDIMKDRLKGSGLDACRKIFAELDKNVYENIEDFPAYATSREFESDVVNLSIKLSRGCFLKGPFVSFDDIDLRILTHAVANFMWKHLLRQLVMKDERSEVSNKYLTIVHSKLDCERYEVCVNLDSPISDFTRLS